MSKNSSFVVHTASLALGCKSLAFSVGFLIIDKIKMLLPWLFIPNRTGLMESVPNKSIIIHYILSR